ncbi:PP2C family protein-serine/threonine phosphatase [Streptomyces sp. MUM 178J]|uniref:PP2C family protein-serine/threonine phosphatase n=1 Tax=Streptomyces sp. MUM 178J TaxID=2791991 RepID=UPI001F04E47A|nr:GAF domain-containing SpoIIE family protein phosphatase [Streptomyces sp. MUM 178J]WRQ80621.1 GAF domain-containing SpoIIE family protein phosphatase [Streptomyces sp. MUM 178J]
MCADDSPAVAGVALLDADANYLFADDAYRRMTGEPAGGLEGRPVGARAADVAGPPGLLAAVLADGRPRTHASPGRRCTWQRMTGARSQALGLIGVLIEQAPGPPPRLHVGAAADRIGTTLDAETTCEELARYVSTALADAAAVDLTAAPDPAAAPLRRTAAAGRTELLADPAAAAVAERAIREGRPVLDDRWLAAPLIARERALGVVLAARAHSRFTRDDVLLAQSAALRAAFAVDHARRYAEARRTGVELQRALLTDPGLPHPNLQLATRYLPAGTGDLVGGDWFETVRLHFGRTLLVMGDVMGHGVASAVDMNSYRAALRDVAAADLPPHRVLRRLDMAISDAASRRPAACLLARVDPARGIVSFSSAGHLPPAVFAGDGAAELVDVPVGPPLGTGLGGYDIVSRRLRPEDTLLLFTDGLVERRGEDIDTSLARLARFRPRPGCTVDELADEVLARLDAAHAADDVALMAARIRERALPEPD